MASPKTQLWTAAIVNRITRPLRDSVVFYAPLETDLSFSGIDPVSFARGSGSTAVWRDGASHTVAVNEPRFSWLNDAPRGILLNPSTETLTFAAANALHNGNSLFWIEDGVVQVSPAATNPFNSSGVWTGTGEKYRKRILKFNKVLSASEIAYITALLPVV